MKVYRFNDPLFLEDELVGNIVQEYTRERILEEYWPHFKEQMDRKFGEGYEDTTEDICIENWMATHWAWEVDIEDESGTQTPPQENDR